MSVAVNCTACGAALYRKPSDIARSKTGRAFCSRGCHASFLSAAAAQVTGLPDWARNALQAARKRAAKKGIAFDLTQSDMIDVVRIASGRCQVSGIPFDLNRGGSRRARRPHFPSLDRIDANFGYERGNVRLVCVAVNVAMNTWGEEILFGIAVSLLSEALPKAMDRGKFRATYKGKTIGNFDNHADAIRALLAAKYAAKMLRIPRQPILRNPTQKWLSA